MMRIETVLINPKKASEILKGNTNNPRNLREAHVNSLAKIMKAGHWKAEHNDDICITKSGKVANGQHRLLAVVQSGVTVTMTVKYDMPEDCGLHMDKGLKRDAADRARQEGIDNSNWVVAGIKSYLLIRKGTVNKGHSLMSNGIIEDELFEEYHHRPEFWQNSILKAVRWYKLLNGYLSPSFLVGWYITLHEIHSEDADNFFEGLCNQVGYTAKSPIKILRSVLERNHIDRHLRKINATYLTAIFIKAWNAYRLKKDTTILKWYKEQDEFPKPI